jgi:hypothetical protein
MNLIEDEVRLETNDEARSLALSRFRHSNGKVFSAQLRIQSSGFACDREILFDGFEAWVEKVAAMDRTMKGEAALSEESLSEPLLRLRLDVQGHLYVEGVVEWSGDPPQRLQFGFVTDLTGLADFAAGLGAVRATAAEDARS